jgi:predicted ATPase/DNA-binding SARP family transcriptional activator/DNA-binding CsgD family transcriptional regulator/Tfp pilus assembly protein PilF
MVNTRSVPEVVRVRLLGGFQVSVGARVIDQSKWRLRKAASLLKLLAITPRHRLHREQAMDLLWPNVGMRAASNSLRQALYAARRVLDPHPDDSLLYLAFQDEQLVLCPKGPLWVDVEAFEEAAATARREKETTAYRAAIELYAGDLLPEDRYEEWAESRREELRGTFFSLLVEVAHLYEEVGDYGPAVEALRRVTLGEPTNEQAHANLMRLYALSGRGAEALAQYKRLSRTLAQKLGVEPGPATRHLHDEIVAGRFARSPTQPTGAARARTADRSRGNLPPRRTSFIGRERELVEIKRALALTRLLTLTGAGGSGKTQLAMEVARDLTGKYRDGVWLVELAPLSQPELVPQAVIRAAGAREQPSRSLVDTLVEALRDKETLLVLDNCEHLVEAAARLVDTLLDCCPRLRVLATSREALSVEGEVLWRVPPLSAPDPRRSPTVGELAGYESVRLFAERARQHDHTFAVTPRNAEAVGEVCGRLDGIPLAVELAAANLGTLTVEQILDRLKNSLGFLTRGSRTAPPRQRTLRKTLDWSYGLLSEQERTLFDRLSVFVGGWTLEAAEKVGAGGDIDDEDVLQLLSRLVDKSLVVIEQSGEGTLRYRMLEPVRQYGRERLVERSEAEAVERRHADFFLALAEEVEPELVGERQGDRLRQLEAERDNLRAVLSRALEKEEAELALRLGGALWRFWLRRGYWSEGRDWLHKALATGGEVAPTVRAKALSGAGWLAEVQDDYRPAQALYEEALALRQESADDLGVTASRVDLGWLAMLRGDHEEATDLLEYGLHKFRELGDERGVGSALRGLASIATSRNNYARAAALHEEALSLYRKLGDNDNIAMSLGDLGWAAVLQGDHRRATAVLEEAVARFREAGLTVEVDVLTNLGFAAMLRGDHGQATERIKEALALSFEKGDKLGIARSLEGMAKVVGTLGKAEKSARLWGAAQAVREDIGVSMRPDEREVLNPYPAIVRSQLEKEAWDVALIRGRTMSLKQAVGYALSEDEPSPPSLQQASTGEPPTALTRREREVAALVARGLTNRQIASELSISEHTAATHVAKILKKLGLSSRFQLTVWVTERRLSSSDLD